MSFYKFTPMLIGEEKFEKNFPEQYKKIKQENPGLYKDKDVSSSVGSKGVANKSSNKTKTILSAPGAVNVTKKALKG